MWIFKSLTASKIFWSSVVTDWWNSVSCVFAASIVDVNIPIERFSSLMILLCSVIEDNAAWAVVPDILPEINWSIFSFYIIKLQKYFIENVPCCNLDFFLCGDELLLLRGVLCPSFVSSITVWSSWSVVTDWVLLSWNISKK